MRSIRPATKAEVNENEKSLREWLIDDNRPVPPYFTSEEVMALVLRIRLLEKRLAKVEKQP